MNVLLVGLAALLTAFAAALVIRPPGSRTSVRRLHAEPVTEDLPDRRPWLRRLIAVVLAAGAVVAGASLGGYRGTVVALAALVAIGTIVYVGLAHARDRASQRAQVDVARACGVLASYVRVGQVPADALLLVARDCPVLTEAAAVQQIGGDVPQVLRARSVRAGHAGLADLARAWQVSTRTGAPLAPALEQVARGLASDESVRSVVSAELAAPRSTGKLMAVLPLAGIGLGYLLGGDPLTWLMAGPTGWGCLLLGLLLAAAGVLWIERLARAAAAGA